MVKSIEPNVKPNSMLINETMVDCKLNNIKRTCESSITGKTKLDEHGNKMYRVKTDEHGKPMHDKNGKPIRERVPEFETINVSYTIDFTDARLQNVLQTAVRTLIIDIARDVRGNGENAVKSINGKTFSFNELMKSGRVRVPTDVKIERELDKVSTDERERILRDLAERFNIKL